MTRTLRRHGRAIALLARREVFRKLSKSSDQQRVREECPLLVQLGTLIHPNQMAARGRLLSPKRLLGRVRPREAVLFFSPSAWEPSSRRLEPRKTFFANGWRGLLGLGSPSVARDAFELLVGLVSA